MAFDVIYADPPWRFETFSEKGKGRSAERHYDCMSVREIAALPVKDLSAPNSVLYLWTTAPFLMWANVVIEAWGFEYKSNIVWSKQNQATGYWVANCHEHLLIAGRGKGMAPRYRGIKLARSVIESRQREHSRKPDEAAEMIEHYHPDARKLELFARPPHRAGWHVWGNQAEGSIAL